MCSPLNLSLNLGKKRRTRDPRPQSSRDQTGDPTVTSSTTSPRCTTNDEPESSNTKQQRPQTTPSKPFLGRNLPSLERNAEDEPRAKRLRII